MVSTEQPIVKLNKSGNRRGMLPKIQANLVPDAQWQPGETGNPRGYSLKSRLQDAVDKPLKDPGEDATAGDRLVHATLKGAIELQSTPFTEAWNRLEGRVVEQHALLAGVDLVVRYVEKGEE